MKKTIGIFACLAILASLAFTMQSFIKPHPVPAPQGTTIVLTYTYWNMENYNPYMKVMFWGTPYPTGQEGYDDACPWYETSSEDPVTVQCDEFYYQEGWVAIYSRETSADPWGFEGYMFMNANNCTMDGSKVTTFTVDTRYLTNPS